MANRRHSASVLGPRASGLFCVGHSALCCGPHECHNGHTPRAQRSSWVTNTASRESRGLLNTTRPMCLNSLTGRIDVRLFWFNLMHLRLTSRTRNDSDHAIRDASPHLSMTKKGFCPVKDRMTRETGTAPKKIFLYLRSKYAHTNPEPDKRMSHAV